MACTIVKLKNGETYSGAIKEWRPAFNWFTLFGEDRVFSFNECESIISPNERVSINSPIEGEEQDKFKEAKRDLDLGRENGWTETDENGVERPYPKEKWE